MEVIRASSLLIYVYNIHCFLEKGSKDKNKNFNESMVSKGNENEKQYKTYKPILKKLRKIIRNSIIKTSEASFKLTLKNMDYYEKNSGEEESKRK